MSADATNGVVEVNSVEVKDAGKSYEVLVRNSGVPVSTIYELPNPQRIVVDIAHGKLAEGFADKTANDFINFRHSTVQDSTPQILRLEFLLKEPATFEWNKSEADIKLAIAKPTQNPDRKNPPAASIPETTVESTPAFPKKSADENKVTNIIAATKNIDSQLPDVNPLDAKLSTKAKAQQMEDAFNFSGYNKERISVEFQKMDLHNVFNFLRQVSGVNIVVDESVQGSLTLVLDDVPWDFALDIILNLKDLEKEDRFNTLVIYPKDKAFKWPEQSKSNLSFQPDVKLFEQEALVIRKQENQPLESMEAKQQIDLAKEAEKYEKYDVAAQYYEKAFELWPTNSQLASKISYLNLVHLQQYPKALLYARRSLERDPKNTAVLLQAAIASANMQDSQTANNYFIQATKTKRPSREALLNYAFFLEERKDYDGSLRILDRYKSLYSEDLDGLVASARIKDKLGRYQAASADYQKIIRLGTDVPPDLVQYIQNRPAVKTSM
ncbi:MAG: hypothetical protein GX640_20940 [Fibrobacter sp.]|nr:hypothetical protein [Fibrobacter sp.]